MIARELPFSLLNADLVFTYTKEQVEDLNLRTGDSPLGNCRLPSVSDLAPWRHPGGRD
jgi:hypothetical protein